MMWRLTYYFFLVATLLIGGLLLVTLLPVPGNVEIKVVQSGSMEPAIHTGGLIIVQKAERYEIGDVITFGADTRTQIPTTHRITAVRHEGQSTFFTTKGDANDGPDPVEVSQADVIGRVIFSVPYVGYLLDFARRPVGFVLLVGVPAALVILDELLVISRELMKRRRAKPESGYDVT